MDNKIAFFNDLKPLTSASPGESTRPLNAILFFLYRFNTGKLISDTNFFDVHFHTKDGYQLAGSLLFFFSLDHINKKKAENALFVEIESEVDSIDEDDYENITDLESNSSLKIYYQYAQESNTAFERPLINNFHLLPDALKGSIKQHDIFNFIYELILNKIWVDSDVFKTEYRNNILYIVFLYLSKHSDFRFNNNYESFVSWLALRGIQWFESDSDQQSLVTKEVYFHLVSYSLYLSFHIVNILLGKKLTSFSVSPPEELVYFFAERTDLRSTEMTAAESESIDEDEESFSDELSSNVKPVNDHKALPRKNSDAYKFIGSDIEESETINSSKKIIAEDFNYSARKLELFEISKLLNDDLIDVPTMSLNQAWCLIQDKWQFYLKSFSSRYFVMSDFVKSAIFNQLKSLKASIFSNWFELKSGSGQRLFIDVVAYDTFKIEFLTYEAKQIQTFMKERLKTKVCFEILEPQAKYLKGLGIFKETYDKQIIAEMRNEELVLKANGILDGITKDLLNSINLHMSNDIYLVNYFSKIDRDLEPPNYQMLDALLRISILSLLMITSDVSLTNVKKIIKSLIDPDIEYSAFDTFDKKQYQNQLVKELSITYRSRIDPSELLNLNQ